MIVALWITLVVITLYLIVNNAKNTRQLASLASMLNRNHQNKLREDIREGVRNEIRESVIDELRNELLENEKQLEEERERKHQEMVESLREIITDRLLGLNDSDAEIVEKHASKKIPQTFRNIDGKSSFFKDKGASGMGGSVVIKKSNKSDKLRGRLNDLIDTLSSLPDEDDLDLEREVMANGVADLQEILEMDDGGPVRVVDCPEPGEKKMVQE